MPYKLPIKNIYILVIFSFFLFSCGSKKKATSPKKTYKVTVKPSGNSSKKNEQTTYNNNNTNKKTNAIIKTALTYSGTPYKYGGTTKKGMDCSGLVYVSFKEHGINLQRTSYMMATQGKEIKLKDVKEGDLLFFGTGKNKRKINHLGLVVDVKGSNIKFIHSTTSRGVIVSSLDEGYWNYAFHHARKIL